MDKPDNEGIKTSPEISRLYVEMEFMRQTINTLMDIVRDQGKAITAILTELNKK